VYAKAKELKAEYKDRFDVAAVIAALDAAWNISGKNKALNLFYSASLNFDLVEERERKHRLQLQGKPAVPSRAYLGMGW
jgi:hypothetical protein